MLDVFDALAMADGDARLATLKDRFIADEIGVAEYEREVDQRLDELLHADELSAGLERRQLEYAIEADVQRMVRRREEALKV